LNTTTSHHVRVLGILGAVTVCLVSQTLGGQQAPATVTVYKTATCGCCRNWVEYMRKAGFDVKAQDVEDIATVKATYGVPPELGSCHTSLAGGYVIEGHVPADAVKRLLRERPAVAGIAVPGMPIGSPGMEVGDRRDPFNIVSFDKQGKKSVYESRR